MRAIQLAGEDVQPLAGGVVVVERPRLAQLAAYDRTVALSERWPRTLRSL